MCWFFFKLKFLFTGESSGDSDENDEDFKPGEESDVAEEYDSNVATSDSDASEGTAGAKANSDPGSDSDSRSKKKDKKEKKESKKTSSSKSVVSELFL